MSAHWLCFGLFSLAGGCTRLTSQTVSLSLSRDPGITKCSSLVLCWVCRHRPGDSSRPSTTQEEKNSPWSSGPVASWRRHMFLCFCQLALAPLLAFRAVSASSHSPPASQPTVDPNQRKSEVRGFVFFVVHGPSPGCEIRMQKAELKGEATPPRKARETSIFSPDDRQTPARREARKHRGPR